MFYKKNGYKIGVTTYIHKLFSIKPNIGEWEQGLRKSRKKHITISQLHIGHIKLTCFFLFKQENKPECIACQSPFTFKHILVECGVFAII